MYILVSILINTILIIKSVTTVNVCQNHLCQCNSDSTIVHCDTKKWKNLDDIDFPSNVRTLTLIDNNLKFDTITDRIKIENLQNLIDLSLNQNPLGIIPLFNNTKIQFLSLQDTLLISAEFPSSYNNSALQRISLSNNKIHSINKNDFLYLINSKLNRLSIDSSSISIIDQNAFSLLNQLQSLSLNNNQLKSCDFLLNIPRLSSIKLDGNQFTSLPQHLTIPGNIKTYSFMNNLISVIDESSPLNIWFKNNFTNNKIYLFNNPFDCCLSLWFIDFLKTSSHFIGDASLLTCATPSNFAGKLLIKLNSHEMNCGSIIPNKSWWTTVRIISVIGGCIIIIGVIIVIIIFIRTRQHPSRSGYTEIDGIDDTYNNINDSLSGGPVFPILDEEYDRFSTNLSTDGRRSIIQSEAPTHTTVDGIYAADGSQTGDSQVHYDALLSPFN